MAVQCSWSRRSAPDAEVHRSGMALSRGAVRLPPVCPVCRLVSLEFQTACVGGEIGNAMDTEGGQRSPQRALPDYPSKVVD